MGNCICCGCGPLRRTSSEPQSTSGPILSRKRHASPAADLDMPLRQAIPHRHHTSATGMPCQTPSKRGSHYSRPLEMPSAMSHTGGPEPTTQLSGFVNASSELVDSVEEFARKIIGHLDNAVENLNSTKRSEIKNNVKAKTACTDLKFVADLAFKYVDKVDDLFYYGKSTERLEKVMRGIKQNNFEELITLIDQLEDCLVQTEEVYQQFDEACKNSKSSSLTATEDCKNKASEAKSQKVKTQAVGGTVATGLVASGVCLSIVAGVGTFGFGTAVGLAVTGVTTAGAGIGAAAVTSSFATGWEEMAQALQGLSEAFDCMHHLASDMHNKVHDVKCKLEVLSGNIDAVKANYQRSAWSLCDALNRQCTKFNEFHVATSSCRQELQSKRDELNNLVIN